MFTFRSLILVLVSCAMCVLAAEEGDASTSADTQTDGKLRVLLLGNYSFRMPHTGFEQSMKALLDANSEKGALVRGEGDGHGHVDEFWAEGLAHIAIKGEWQLPDHLKNKKVKPKHLKKHQAMVAKMNSFYATKPDVLLLQLERPEATVPEKIATAVKGYRDLCREHGVRLIVVDLPHREAMSFPHAKVASGSATAESIDAKLKAHLNQCLKWRKYFEGEGVEYASVAAAFTRLRLTHPEVDFHAAYRDPDDPGHMTPLDCYVACAVMAGAVLGKPCAVLPDTAASVKAWNASQAARAAKSAGSKKKGRAGLARAQVSIEKKDQEIMHEVAAWALTKWGQPAASAE